MRNIAVDHLLGGLRVNSLTMSLTIVELKTVYDLCKQIGTWWVNFNLHYFDDL